MIGQGLLQGPYVDRYFDTPMRSEIRFSLMELDQDLMTVIRDGVKNELEDLEKRIGRISKNASFNLIKQEELRMATEKKFKIKSLLMKINKELNE